MNLLKCKAKAQILINHPLNSYILQLIFLNFNYEHYLALSLYRASSISFTLLANHLSSEEPPHSQTTNVFQLQQPWTCSTKTAFLDVTFRSSKSLPGTYVSRARTAGFVRFSSSIVFAITRTHYTTWTVHIVLVFDLGSKALFRMIPYSFISLEIIIV